MLAMDGVFSWKNGCSNSSCHSRTSRPPHTPHTLLAVHLVAHANGLFVDLKMAPRNQSRSLAICLAVLSAAATTAFAVAQPGRGIEVALNDSDSESTQQLIGRPVSNLKRWAPLYHSACSFENQEAPVLPRPILR